jgi:hypothetical protein
LTGSSSAATPKTVNGAVGPGFKIGLTMQGKKVTKLKVGKPYRFVISDRADIHDFHLSGPGLDRVLTSVEFTGTKTFVLRLKKGAIASFATRTSASCTAASWSLETRLAAKTGGSPRCEPASDVSTIAVTTQIIEPYAAHSKGEVRR